MTSVLLFCIFLALMRLRDGESDREESVREIYDRRLREKGGRR